MSLTVAYITNRRDPRVEWFLCSLARELRDGPSYHLVVVDHFANTRPLALPPGTVHVPPKPNVWNGPHRLTREDWYACSNSRNTALCLARSEWIVYCDDLSVLLPGWGAAVRAAMAGGYIVAGAYRKVRGLEVENGAVVHFDAGYTDGTDTRIAACAGRPDPVPANGDWLYGCNLAAPVESLLSINGWDENCDGVGGEDYCTGIRLSNAGWPLYYDRRMMEWEADELHFVDKPFVRRDKGVSPNDKSHALLHMARATAWCPNYFGEGGIRLLRDRVLAGEPFPPAIAPEHDFFDGQSLREM